MKVFEPWLLRWCNIGSYIAAWMAWNGQAWPEIRPLSRGHPVSQVQYKVKSSHYFVLLWFCFVWGFFVTILLFIMTYLFLFFCSLLSSLQLMSHQPTFTKITITKTKFFKFECPQKLIQRKQMALKLRATHRAYHLFRTLLKK